jgi:hypothetical protein
MEISTGKRRPESTVRPPWRPLRPQALGMEKRRARFDVTQHIAVRQINDV